MSEPIIGWTNPGDWKWWNEMRDEARTRKLVVSSYPLHQNDIAIHLAQEGSAEAGFSGVANVPGTTGTGNRREELGGRQEAARDEITPPTDDADTGGARSIRNAAGPSDAEPPCLCDFPPEGREFCPKHAAPDAERRAVECPSCRRMVDITEALTVAGAIGYARRGADEAASDAEREELAKDGKVLVDRDASEWADVLTIVAARRERDGYHLSASNYRRAAAILRGER